MAIIDGYIATISGHTVTFAQPIVEWTELRDCLAEAAGLHVDRRAEYLPKENKPNSELGDHVRRYDLTDAKDFVLVPYDKVHRDGYQVAKDIVVPTEVSN